MKKTIFKTLLVFCSFFFLSCQKKGPEQVTMIFFKSMYSGDFESAKSYGTASTKAMLTMLESFGAQHQIKDNIGKTFAGMEITETKIDGDKATCNVKMLSKEGKNEESPVNLVKQEGEWLVNIQKESKESMNKEGMNNMSKEIKKSEKEPEKERTPEQVAIKYLKIYYPHDFGPDKGYSDEELTSKEWVTKRHRSNSAKENYSGYEVTGVKIIGGNKAVYSIQMFRDEGKNDKCSIHLIEQEGKWSVEYMKHG